MVAISFLEIREVVAVLSYSIIKAPSPMHQHHICMPYSLLRRCEALFREIRVDRFFIRIFILRGYLPLKDLHSMRALHPSPGRSRLTKVRNDLPRLVIDISHLGILQYIVRLIDPRHALCRGLLRRLTALHAIRMMCDAQFAVCFLRTSMVAVGETPRTTYKSWAGFTPAGSRSSPGGELELRSPPAFHSERSS